MIKCTHKGKWTCIGRSGVPKKSFDTDVSAISAAKLINQKNKGLDFKLVAYRCTECSKYHLFSKKINNK
jgi:hypothetical protein